MNKNISEIKQFEIKWQIKPIIIARKNIIDGFAANSHSLHILNFFLLCTLFFEACCHIKGE